MSRPALVLLAGLGLSGCDRSGLVTFPHLDTSDPGSPALWISPGRIEFSASLDPQFDTFSISNVGDADLAIEELSLDGDTAFTLLGDPPPASLAPGTIHEMVIQYDSGTAWAHASIWLRSDDPGNPLEQLTVQGAPLAPELWLTPTTVDFGEVTPGCIEEQELVLINLGKVELELQAIQYSTENRWLRISQAPALPLVLEPGEATTVTVAFEPEGEGEDSATLLVFSSDPEIIATATQRGRAAWEWVHLEGFDLMPLELLLVADQTAGMSGILAELGTRVPDLLDELDAAGLDWRASVLAREDGCIHAGPVSAEDRDPARTLMDGLLDTDPTQTTDQLLQLLYTALLRSDEDDCNGGAIRDDSLLHGVVVSDQGHPGPEPATYYLGELLERLGSDRLRISALVGDPPAGCPGATAGTGYDEAVEATDGRLLSVCTELDRLPELSEASRRAVIDLPSTPDPSTLVVQVEGMGWTDGWHLSEALDRVVFDVQPEAGDSVAVDYGVMACD